MYQLYENQKKEIETISGRTLTINLSDADCERLCWKAGEVGLTVSGLLENFIGDLVGGTYSNGSDERMYADQWFERCGFTMFSEHTFLRYLLNHYEIDNFISCYEEVKEFEENASRIKKNLETGKIHSYFGECTWKDITSLGKPVYGSEEEWRAELRSDLGQEEVEKKYAEDELKEIWNAYMEKAGQEAISWKEELEKVLEWKEQMENFKKG